MNDSTLDPDDPRITAYALGELPEGADRTAVELLLSESSQARASVEEIRSLVALLEAEYESERQQPEKPDVAAVIEFPARAKSPRNRWVHPLLRIAAMVAFIAGLGVLFFPSNRKNEYASLSPSVARSASPTPLTAAESAPPVVAAQPPAEVASASKRPDSGAASEGIPLQAQPASPVEEQVRNKADIPATDSDAKGLFADSSNEKAPSDGRALFALAPTPPLENERFAKLLELSPTLAPSGQAASVPALPASNSAVAGAGTATGFSSGLAGSSPGIAATAPAPPEVKSKSRTINFFGARDNVAGQSNDSGKITASAKSAPAKPTSVVSATHVTTRRMDVARNSTFAGGIGGIAYPFVSEAKPVGKDLADSSITLDDRRAGEKPSFDKSKSDTATYDHIVENPFLAAKDNPLSTFSIDVDTASYTNVRRFIESGSLPPKDAVRIEEMLNYFPYHDAGPSEGDKHPFALHLEAAACPWNTEHRLVRIGIKGREIARDKRPPSNLVFLVDVSGSMQPPERLPLIKECLRLMVEKLSEDDHVAIVVYAANTGLALPSTSGDQKEKILDQLARMEAGGSTNGAGGIQLAYKVARENFIKGGVNRVILATDGDFNVGITSQGELVRLIEREAKGGVFLSALGVGTDNYKDSTMQKLADRGNGNYSYIDRLEEGRKVLIEQMSGTLVTIAKDVKIQVEFNPAVVASYRLIGYEKRMLRKEDFNDDKVDAGEIGAGHSVTALYEVIPAGPLAGDSARQVDALKYQTPAEPSPSPRASGDGPAEMLTLKMRYKAPDADKSERAYEQPLVDHGSPDDYAKASPDFKFAAAVAGFGLVLRDSPNKGSLTLASVVELAGDGKGEDASGYRGQFIDLARKAQTLMDRREGND